MASVIVHIDDRTMKILQAVSRETERTIEDLAECAIAEAALDELRRNSEIEER